MTDTDILSAALLHDTVEDTGTTLEELEDAFGLAVCKLVEEVSDDKDVLCTVTGPVHNLGNHPCGRDLRHDAAQ